MTPLKALKIMFRLYMKGLRLFIIAWLTKDSEKLILFGLQKELEKMDREMEETDRQYEEYKTRVLNRGDIIEFAKRKDASL